MLGVLRPVTHIIAPNPPALPSVLVTGARTGAVPLLIAHLFNFRVRITAIEADPDRFAVIESNLAVLDDGGIARTGGALLTTDEMRRAAGKVALSTAGGAEAASDAGGGAAGWGGGLAERLRGLGASDVTVPAMSVTTLQVRRSQSPMHTFPVNARQPTPFGLLARASARVQGRHVVVSSSWPRGCTGFHACLHICCPHPSWYTLLPCSMRVERELCLKHCFVS